MSQMIKDILNILVVDVDVKRLFSVTRDVIDYHQNRLKKTTIENIMIVKKNYEVFKQFLETIHALESLKMRLNDEEFSKELMKSII